MRVDFSFAHHHAIVIDRDLVYAWEQAQIAPCLEILIPRDVVGYLVILSDLLEVLAK